MNVLLLGSGGREHAIAWKLAQSPRLTKLWAAPGSDAIAQFSQIVAIDPLNPQAVTEFIQSNNIDLLFIGPEAPLAAGVSDAARRAGIAVFGPSKEAAQLETSKAFAKEFMSRYKIPTARAFTCLNSSEAQKAAREFNGRCAVKADGLALGKGVIVCANEQEAFNAIQQLMATPAGKKLIIEERLEGPEVTVMAICDGNSFAVLPFSQDHKRLGDNDTGPNTGGMGAIAPVPIDKATWKRIKEEILNRTLFGLSDSQIDYRGAIYAGIMLTQNGPKLLEYNARFGDPETQAVLPLISEDLLELALNCANGKLEDGFVPANNGACTAITMASPGYPESPKTGIEIDLSTVDSKALLFHAGTKKAGRNWISSGGRVLTVVGRGVDLASARNNAYLTLQSVKAPGLHFRRDIGAKSIGRPVL